MSVPDGYAEGYEAGARTAPGWTCCSPSTTTTSRRCSTTRARQARITGTVRRAGAVAQPPERHRGQLHAPRPRPDAGGDLAHAVPDDACVSQEGKRYLFEGHKVIRKGGVRPRLVRDDDALHHDQRGGRRRGAGHRDPPPEAGRLHQAGPQHQGRRRAAPAAGRVPAGVPGAVRPRDGAHLRRRRSTRPAPSRARRGRRPRSASPRSRTGSGGATAPAASGTPTTGSATTRSCG